MAIPKLLPTLRRVTYFFQSFSQSHVAHKFDVYQYRVFSTHKKSIINEIDNDGATAKKERPKTVPIPKITLLSPDDSIVITNLENALRLAKRRNLSLVKVSDADSKSQRPTYKLVSGSSFVDDVENIKDVDKTTEKYKETKLFYISAKIAKHDLLIKTKNVTKLLKKSHKVKIVINVDDANKEKNETQSIVENAVKDHGQVQKMPSKKNIILLVITPLLNKDSDNSVDIKETNVSNINGQDNT